MPPKRLRFSTTSAKKYTKPTLARRAGGSFLHGGTEGFLQPFESASMTHIATATPAIIPTPRSETFSNADAVILRLPMSRSTWVVGVKAGRYPQPIRFSPKRPVWRDSDIDAFIASL